MLQTASSAAPPSRLSRRLNLADAVVVGLGSMIGAGIFVAFAPAAQAGSAGLLAGLGVAAAVAFCNATSSARLAALYPRSGGTYVYATERLGHLWGYLAGWAFVVGKAASCTAMALTLGHYVAPSLSRPLAVAAVAALTAVNLRGVDKTAVVTRVLVGFVILSLAVFVIGALAGVGVHGGKLPPYWSGGVHGVLRSAAFLFFAFAGYARIATLGEEVVDPARTIPRAIPLALALALGVYATVAAVALAVAGPAALAASSAPLRTVLAAKAHALTPVIAVGAAVAALGVLLSLLAGVSRTLFAMARQGDLPHALGAVSARRRVPHVAELAVAAAVAAVASLVDVRGAIGFSSFCVLLYYALANASAVTLRGDAFARALGAAGIAGCLALAFALPLASILAGAAVVAAGAGAYVVRARGREPEPAVDALSGSRPSIEP